MALELSYTRPAHTRTGRRLALTLASLALASLAGCQKSAGDNAQVSASSDEAPASGDACRLLERSEVNATFSGAKSGEVDKSREQYGISACTWETEHGRVVAQYWKSVGASASEEASSLALGFVDPLKSGAEKNVRFESIPGVGSQAVAVVESQDAQRGILNDVAMLVAQSGDQILVIIAPQLAHSSRDSALGALKTLGSQSVKRL